MRRLAATIVLCAFLIPHQAAAGVFIHIDKSSQRMSVSVDGEPRYHWRVSTGRAGYGTPTGRFRPQRLARKWFSSKYYNSPMPYSIFFHRGYAIHGSNEIKRLGGPASHGCVRLHPTNASVLFHLVQKHGKRATRIVVTGENPVPVAHARPKLRSAQARSAERERRLAKREALAAGRAELAARRAAGREREARAARREARFYRRGYDFPDRRHYYYYHRSGDVRDVDDRYRW